MSGHTERMIIAAVGGVIGGAAVLALVAHYQKLQPPVVNLSPVTVVRPSAPSVPTTGPLFVDNMPTLNAGPAGTPVVTLPAIIPNAASPLTRSEQRLADRTWSSLTQLEINHLQMLLQDVPGEQRGSVVILCEFPTFCGDLQSDFENAFETAHWPTELERPVIDKSIGLSTSSPAIKEAIEKATNGRLKVNMIRKDAAAFALVIGKRQ